MPLTSKEWVEILVGLGDEAHKAQARIRGDVYITTDAVVRLVEPYVADAPRWEQSGENGSNRENTTTDAEPYMAPERETKSLLKAENGPREEADE